MYDINSAPLISQGQLQINQGKICPYCSKTTEYTDSSKIYGKSYGMVYLCRPCNAWVGVHKGTDNALGRLADKELRFWKREAHAAFDPVWKLMLNRGEPKHVVRNREYDWLSAEMNLTRELTHIGFMDVSQCKMVVQICQKRQSLPVCLPVYQIETEPPAPQEQQIIQPGILKTSDGKYEFFDKVWLPKFKKELQDDIWYDAKKFCYTLNLFNKEDETATIDFYPKADKLLIRQENRWVKSALNWLIENLL